MNGGTRKLRVRDATIVSVLPRILRSLLGVSLLLFLCVTRGRAHDLGPALVAVTGAFSAAPAGRDDGLDEAREIARRVRGFPNFRGAVAHGRFRTLASARWRFRASERCLDAAGRAKVPFAPLLRPLATPVPTPVTILGPIQGVSFRPVQKERAIELDCELAARLVPLARILRGHGVRTVHVNSSYREQPRVSFHTFGLALDVSAFETREQVWNVARDFELTPDVPTCEGAPSTAGGRALLGLACELAESGLFSTVITPNYNAGHRDHFHLDVRPNDPKLFVR